MSTELILYQLSLALSVQLQLANQGSRQAINKRDRSEKQAENKRRKIENGEEVTAPIYATQFSKEEIANEERRPKKKVAILMGYSGTGYFGMQLYVFCATRDLPHTSIYCNTDISLLGTRTKKPSKETCSPLWSPPVPFPKPTPRIPRSRHLFAVLELIRVCTLLEMWYHSR